MIKKIARMGIIAVGLALIGFMANLALLAGVPYWLIIVFWGGLVIGTVLGEVFKSVRTA
jgi:ribose/xylose/arabinose/galactoside ABC-type transport system permease subunit